MTLRQGDVLDAASVTDLARGQEVLLSAVGPVHGGDQLIVDDQGQSRISAEDLAVAIVDEVEQPRHRRQGFTVAY